MASVMKLTIMQIWRIRCRRVKRTNCRSPPGVGGLVVPGDGVSKTSPSGIGVLLFSELLGGMRFGGAQFPAHLESSGEPEQGMNAADDECSQEQPGHTPEGVEHERIFLGVVVGGVSQITGKAPCRTGMALLAGSRHVRPA